MLLVVVVVMKIIMVVVINTHSITFEMTLQRFDLECRV